MRPRIAIDKAIKAYPNINKDIIKELITFGYDAGYAVGKEDESNKGNYYYEDGDCAFYNKCVDNETHPLDSNYNVILYSNKDFSIVLTERGYFKITGYGNKVYTAILLQRSDISYVSKHGYEWKLDFDKNAETFADGDDCEHGWSNRLQTIEVIADGKQYLYDRSEKNVNKEYYAKDGGILRDANLYYEGKNGELEKFSVGFVKVK